MKNEPPSDLSHISTADLKAMYDYAKETYHFFDLRTKIQIELHTRLQAMNEVQIKKDITQDAQK